MALISEKIRKRVKLYTSVDDVEIDKKLLPQEYGGVMPMKEMIGMLISNGSLVYFQNIYNICNLIIRITANIHKITGSLKNNALQ